MPSGLCLVTAVCENHVTIKPINLSLDSSTCSLFMVLKSCNSRFYPYLCIIPMNAHAGCSFNTTMQCDRVRLWLLSMRMLMNFTFFSNFQLEGLPKKPKAKYILQTIPLTVLAYRPAPRTFQLALRGYSVASLPRASRFALASCSHCSRAFRASRSRKFSKKKVCLNRLKML